MVEWYPGEAMKDFVYILDTMHETSKRIFEKKKRALYGQDEAALNESEREEGDLGPLMQGKDIMSILRERGPRISAKLLFAHRVLQSRQTLWPIETTSCKTTSCSHRCRTCTLSIHVPTWF